MPFAAGLEQFGALGSLDWDEEFEELVFAGATVDDHSETGDEMDLSTKTTESELSSLSGGFDDINPVIGRSYQLAPTDEVMSAEDTIIEHAIRPESPTPEVPLPLEEHIPTVDGEEDSHTSSTSQSFHPGWSEETPSWYKHTSTSPQVVCWAASQGIFNDIKWTMDTCRDDYMVNNDIPRVSSCMLRAIQHLYPVPLDAEIGYPIGAMGEKIQMRCCGPIHLFPRGSMGLKDSTDPDVPSDVYVPNGIKVLPPSPNGRAFYPRPSPLRYVANIDDDQLSCTTQRELAIGDQAVGISHRHIVENQPAKHFRSVPSLVFMSGENYLDEDIETTDMEPEELTIQEYGQEESEEIEFSPDEITEFSSEDIVDFSSEELIEAQFEIGINGGTVPSDVVDLYSSSEGSRSWPSSPPLPFRELDSPATIYEDEIYGLLNDETTYDLPELALTPRYKIPGLGLAQGLDSPPFHSAYYAHENFVGADYGSPGEDSDECGLELLEVDDLTSDEIDQAISRLEGMSLVSPGEVLECKHAPSTDLPSTAGTESGDANTKAPLATSDQVISQKPYSFQVTGGGVGIATVVGAVCHTIWSICSANPLSVFLF